MKTNFKILFILVIYMIISSFTITKNHDNIYRKTCYISINNTVDKSIDKIVITYDKTDVCGLKYLGQVSVSEKRWFYNNNGLKKETQTELKKQASEKGGNIVFVDIKEKKGVGIFFTTTITGYVYK